MKNKVHYLNFYADPEAAKFLVCFPSAFPKVEYVSNALVEAGFEVVNLSSCQYKKGCKSISVRKVDVYRTFRYLRNSRFLQRIDKRLSILYSWFQILLYVIFRVKKNETLLVYHSMFYLSIVKFAMRFKKIRLIYEVEELFYSLSPSNASFKEKELDGLRQADAYLLVNDLLKDKIGSISDKPIVISYSAYKLPGLTSLQLQSWDDKIHIVYAGCIEQRRKAAFMAVEAAKYLSNKYKVHILGFGDDTDIDELKKLIQLVNSEPDCANAIFEGSKFGSEYSDFLSHCQIGLSCHTYDDSIPESADCTFPSKVFVYLLHGLTVVSFPLRCLSESAVSDFVSFAETSSVESLAEAIQKCKVLDRDSTIEHIDNMHNEFVKHLKFLINGKH